MEKLEEMTGIATMNDVPSVVFLNFGPEPQSAVGSTQDLGTDYSNIKMFARYNFELDENGGAFSKRVENLWERRNCAVRPNLLSAQCFQIFLYKL